jgi:hypothetical protein
VTYTASEARKELLGEVAGAIEELSSAIAAVGEAYDAADEAMADRIEADLFKPLQGAYGAATRTYAGFASRAGLPSRKFAPAPLPAPHGVRELVEKAVDDTAHAEQILADLQDSMAPVEVGDPELRAGLADVRRRLGNLPAQGERLIGRIGR